MSSRQKPAVIALTGYAGAGKDSFAKLLQEAFAQKGISAEIVASGDLIRTYVREHNLGDPGDRAVLQQTVTSVATTHGFLFWLKRSIEVAKDVEVLLYPGLRQTVEVDYLHQRGDIIIGIDVPIETRYERAQKRARPGDEITFERFQENEAAERYGKGQQIAEVMKSLDVTVVNNGSFEQLRAVAERIAASFPDSLQHQYNANL